MANSTSTPSTAATKAVSRLTSHEDFPVLAASAGGGRVAYEQAGYLHLLDPKTATSTRLRLAVSADLVERRPRWAKGTKWIRNGSLSPTGARVALEFRGEIVTLPREKGDDRNLTHTPGVHERSPAWSPDGRTIAYFSDESGEYALHLAPQDGKGEVKKVALQGAGFYTDPDWSPDGKRLSYWDNSHSLWTFEIATGRETKISSNVLYGPAPVLQQAWSPDSRFLAYTRNTKMLLNQVFIYSLADAKSHAVSDGLADAASPVFDASRKVSLLRGLHRRRPRAGTGSRKPAPTCARRARSIWPCSPRAWRRRSPRRATRRRPKEEEKPGAKKDEKKEDKKPPVEVKVDPEGLAERIVAMPMKARGLRRPGAGGGESALLQAGRVHRPGCRPGPLSLRPGEAKGRQLLGKADGFALSRTRSASSCRSRTTGTSWTWRTSSTSRSSSWTWAASRSRRPARGMGGDVPRGLADQSRLLLRSRLSWRRLAGLGEEVRASS